MHEIRDQGSFQLRGIIMTITTATLIADIASARPATIKVFQRHRIDFCCGGKISLAELCTTRKLDVGALIAELDAALLGSERETDWSTAPLTNLVAHIQRRFHRPLNAELPRLRAMLDKVGSRHGERFPEMIPALARTFAELQDELVAHMAKEDLLLFPAIVELEAGVVQDWTWISQPIDVMEAEHASAGAALAKMHDLTSGYTPPEGACPTFRGLFHGLEELEREMHVHVHLENHVLFPRAAALAARVAAGLGLTDSRLSNCSSTRQE
jgi:regulator of cell morphogenesis and NO signaling